jgi:tetratricopeptide (TPR) repeat protein
MRPKSKLDAPSPNGSLATTVSRLSQEFPFASAPDAPDRLTVDELKNLWHDYGQISAHLQVQLCPSTGLDSQAAAWVIRPAGAGLPATQLVYAVVGGTQKVHREQAAMWGRSDDELFATALGNTLGSLRLESGLMRIGDTRIRVLDSPQETAATAILEPRLLELQEAGTDWLISIPNSRCILAIPRRSSGQEVENLAFAAHCLFQASRHPVSPAQFAWNPATGLQPLSARVNRRITRKDWHWPYWLAGTVGVLVVLQVMVHGLLVDSARDSSRTKDPRSSRIAADRALAISLTPSQEARARHWRAVSLYDEEHEDEALAEELHALSLNPEASAPQALLSVLYLRRNDLERAQAHAQRVVEKKDTYAEVHWVLSKIALKKGRIAAARLHMQRAITLAPGESYYVNALKKLPLPPTHGN